MTKPKKKEKILTEAELQIKEQEQAYKLLDFFNTLIAPFEDCVMVLESKSGKINLLGLAKNLDSLSFVMDEQQRKQNNDQNKKDRAAFIG